jgi:hypothetical protein
MYSLLLVFGTAIVAAGIALVGSGVSIQDHTFDPGVITPGVVAIVGGLILVGLAFILQQLRSIEKAIVSRAVIGPIQSETSTGVLAAELPSNPAVPGLPKAAVVPIAEVEPQPAVPILATPAAQEAERLREKFPSLLRLDNAPVVEDGNLSTLSKPSVHTDEEVDETKNFVAVRQASGAGVARSGPRLDVNVPSNGASARVRNIDSFWPKRKRLGNAAPAVVLQTTVSARSAEPVLPIAQASSPELDPAVKAVVAPEAPMPISILKSGVVDGMAYTLYSDGSIEAQLPQGMLRFGSITELRNHIEQSA